MEIKVLDSNVNYYKESESIHVLAFGRMQLNSEAETRIKIEGVSNPTLLSTCGCSVALAEGEDTYFIKYNNTDIPAPFSKVFILKYTEDNKNKQAQIKITGNVIK